MTGPRTGLGGMTGAGLLIVGTVCISTLMAVASTAWRFASTGDLDMEAVAWSAGLVATASALLARTWGSTNESEPPQPVEVVQPEDQPVPVAEAPARRARKRITPRPAVSIGGSTPPDPAQTEH